MHQVNTELEFSKEGEEDIHRLQDKIYVTSVETITSYENVLLMAKNALTEVSLTNLPEYATKEEALVLHLISR